MIDRDFTVMCANAPRTFLNEDGCFLSDAPTACSATSQEYDRPEAFFQISHETIRSIYEITGAGAPGTVYLYAIDGLDINRDASVDSPCLPGSRSRWIPVPCSGVAQDIRPVTSQLMSRMINYFEEEDENELMVDVYHPQGLEFSCVSEDLSKVGYEVPNFNDDTGTNCWKNVHPDHVSMNALRPPWIGWKS